MEKIIYNSFYIFKNQLHLQGLLLDFSKIKILEAKERRQQPEAFDLKVIENTFYDCRKNAFSEEVLPIDTSIPDLNENPLKDDKEIMIKVREIIDQKN